MRKGQLDGIVASVKVRYNLPDIFVISSHLGRKRFVRKSLIVMNRNGKGTTSSLILYESGFVDLIAEKSRIHGALTPSDEITIINDSIPGTPDQTSLVKWKC